MFSYSKKIGISGEASTIDFFESLGGIEIIQNYTTGNYDHQIYEAAQDVLDLVYNDEFNTELAYQY